MWENMGESSKYRKRTRKLKEGPHKPKGGRHFEVHREEKCSTGEAKVHVPRKKRIPLPDYVVRAEKVLREKYPVLYSKYLHRFRNGKQESDLDLATARFEINSIAAPVDVLREFINVREEN